MNIEQLKTELSELVNRMATTLDIDYPYPEEDRIDTIASDARQIVNEIDNYYADIK